MKETEGGPRSWNSALWPFSTFARSRREKRRRGERAGRKKEARKREGKREWIKRANRAKRGRKKRARYSYEFHGRASLLRLLKTVEMLVPAEKEVEGERVENNGRSGDEKKKKGGKTARGWIGGRSGRVGSAENRANLGPGHAREISAYGEITPRREISPRGEFRRAHVEKYVTAWLVY